MNIPGLPDGERNRNEEKGPETPEGEVFYALADQLERIGYVILTTEEAANLVGIDPLNHEGTRADLQGTVAAAYEDMGDRIETAAGLQHIRLAELAIGHFSELERPAGPASDGDDTAAETLGA